MATLYSDDIAPLSLNAPVDVNDSNLDKLLHKASRVVVDCWAPWCGPCRMLAPVIDELAADLSGSVVFAKLNTDENQEMAMKYQIRGIPTLLVFKDGKLADRIVGVLPKEMLK